MKENLGIFQPGPYFPMFVGLMEASTLKVGLILKEVDAAGSRETS